MQRTRPRSWFRCSCGHTFRSVTNRRRGLRKCPSCQLEADHRVVLPPIDLTNEALENAEQKLLAAALATAHAARRTAYPWILTKALDELKAAEEKYRQVAYAQ